MTHPYREIHPLPETVTSSAPRGLVRLNGSACTCSPPGSLWCWWNDVGLGDRWECPHGGAWVRWRDGGEAAAWHAGGILTKEWELPNWHPMTEALAVMGWARKSRENNSSLWTPPGMPPSSAPTEKKR